MTDAVFLNRRWRLSLQKLTETKNGIQRGAQFVAHAREKLAFCLAGPFDFFDAPAFGDVFNGSFVVGNFAFAISDRARVFTEPSPALVLPKDFILEELDRSMRFDRLLEFVAAFWIDINRLLNVAHTGN